ncbi:hypothetical protein C2E21_3921 [Chlorella sorokiniana]|uniref:Membrane protein insertion efficiency factor n=1 Tax=Chlorella sorokiniana TaxID=3076 RepID=A0A2P6TSP2_CHLSO|nr:hypothetical protein C2E21_3921 [Chlorella sorokiniana]|eukprot:PRW57085.1 hypothetical protein C2E21_3921 [Chlorella sorokiniana]
MAALVLAAAPPSRTSGPLSSRGTRSQAAAALPRPSRRRLEVTACARCLAAGRRPLVPALQQPGCRGPAAAAAVKKEAERPSLQTQQQRQQRQQAGDESSTDRSQQGAAPAGEEQQQDSIGVRAALAALKFYKGAISPLLPPACRFLPTCSVYSMDAFQRYGVGKGFVLTAWRLLRCQPFSRSKGYDPVRWPPPGLEFIFKE